MILVFFGNIAQFIMLLITMRVATSYLTPAEMGRLSLITAATAFYVLFLVNPIGMFINRRLHAWDALGISKLYLNVYGAYLLLVSVLAGASIYLLNLFGVFGGEFSTAWLVILICGSIFFTTTNQTVIPSLNLLGFRLQYFVLTVATIILSLILAYLLVITFVCTAEYWQAGIIIGQVVLAAIGASVLYSKLSPVVIGKFTSTFNLQTIYAFAWPIAISVAFNWMQMQGYRFLVSDELGLKTLGLFVAGYGISAGMIAAFESLLVTYFQPKFYKSVSDSNSIEQSIAWNTYADAFLPPLVLVIMTLIAIAPELTRFMVGPSFQSAAEFVMWGAVAEGFRVIASVYGMAAHGKMNTKLLIAPNVLGALMCTAFVLFLTPDYGASGLGLARALGGVSLILSMHLLMTKRLEVKLPALRLCKAAVAGLMVLCLTSASRQLIFGLDKLVYSGILIILVGLVFLTLLYWLVSPVLQKKQKCL